MDLSPGESVHTFPSKVTHVRTQTLQVPCVTHQAEQMLPAWTYYTVPGWWLTLCHLHSATCRRHMRDRGQSALTLDTRDTSCVSQDPSIGGTRRKRTCLSPKMMFSFHRF